MPYRQLSLKDATRHSPETGDALAAFFEGIKQADGIADRKLLAALKDVRSLRLQMCRISGGLLRIELSHILQTAHVHACIHHPHPQEPPFTHPARSAISTHLHTDMLSSCPPLPPVSLHFPARTARTHVHKISLHTSHSFQYPPPLRFATRL